MGKLLLLAALAAAPLLIAALDADALPRPNHVVIVIEENHSYQGVLTHPDADYIRALAAAGASFTSSYGVAHPSQPNYLALFSGSTQGVSSNSCPHSFSTPNLGSRLLGAGLTFAGYSESMPTVGYLGCSSGAYWRKHNPWSDFVDLPVSTNLRFADFPDDFDALPTVAFVVPNQDQDMHDGSIADADAWLRAHIDPYVQWAATHDSMLILTWDEADPGSGNHIPTLFVGPMVTPGSYDLRITHYDVLRTLEDMYGLEPLGESLTARAIGEAFAPASASPETAPAASGSALVVDTLAMQLKLNKPGRDSLLVRGSFPVPPDFQPDGQRLVIDVGGIVREFILDARGRSRRDPANPGASLALSVGEATASFKLRLRRFDLASAFADEGIGSTDASDALTGVRVACVVDGTLFETIEPLRYSARPGHFATASSAQ